MRKKLGFWGQMARGRAIARTNAMRRARSLKRTVDFVEAGLTTASDAARALKTPLSVELRYGLSDDRLTAFVLEMLKKDIAFEARVARDANRRWRKYRKLELAEREEETTC